LEQLEEVIKGIRRLMLRSAQESVSRKKLNRGKPAIAATTKQWSRWIAPKNSLGSRRISTGDLGIS
jgi:hypothetical protein